MADFVNIKVSQDFNTDVLSIEAVSVATGNTITAQGWISAMTNHFPDESYTEDKDGNLVRNVKTKSRQMTSDEKRSYILQLLADVDVQPVVPEPVKEDLSDLFN